MEQFIRRRGKEHAVSLTKERITGLCYRVTGSAMSDEDKDTMRELAEYWKSQQPKVCKNCGVKRVMHWQIEAYCSETDDSQKYEE